MKRPFALASAARPLVLAGVLGIAAAGAASAQTLTIGVRGGPDSIDPHFTATGTHAEALKHIFDTLVWSGDGLELEPRLAESWKAIDPTTWEFKLRKGVKFHDGSDFTAEDVKFSIERIPMVAGPNPTTIYVRRVKETKIVDPHTIHVITDGPAPNLPNDFIRLFIVSHKAAAGLTKETANEAFNSGKAAPGTGPYKFVSWTPKAEFVVDRFDGFWGGKEPWAKVVRKEIPNDAARVAQLKTGQLDLITRVPASDVATLEKDAKLTVVKVDTVYVFNIEMDVREQPPAGQITAKDGSPLPKNPFLDIRVREAIDLAIDRKALAEIAMEGLGKPINQLVTPSIFGFNKALPERKYDVAAAKKLMADAGQADFEHELITVEDEWQKNTGDAIAGQLRDAGIKVKRTVLPGSTFWNDWTKYPYSMTIWYMRPLGVQVLALGYRSGEAWNETAYANPDFDAKLKQALSLADPDKRKEVMKDVEQILQDSGVIIQPFWQKLYCHMSKKVKNYGMHQTYEMDFQNVWLEA